MGYTHERPPIAGRLDLHQRRRMPSALRVLLCQGEEDLTVGGGGKLRRRGLLRGCLGHGVLGGTALIGGGGLFCVGDA